MRVAFFGLLLVCCFIFADLFFGLLVLKVSRLSVVAGLVAS